ncbi:MAG: DUF4169 family protein [Novosphingobium sp.]|nr:DUF4169 family protein [Novosphingobium sp.]
MAEIINLRMARKARARAEAGRKAEANRRKHGETAAERQRREMAGARLAREVDGARREPAPDRTDGTD